MTHKIRLGFVGANVRATWASQSHFPALLAQPGCRADRRLHHQVRECRRGASSIGRAARLPRLPAMVASPAIDAVAVVVKVPEHYGPTRAALEAGKEPRHTDGPRRSALRRRADARLEAVAHALPGGLAQSRPTCLWLVPHPVAWCHPGSAAQDHTRQRGFRSNGAPLAP
jgi:hypothetical protein